MEKIIRPAPSPPQLNEYEHLTEKDRMIRGFPYIPGDDELIKERISARILVRKFNDSGVEALNERKEIVKQLFSSCSSPNVSIEQPFFCDYGYNITLGGGVEINIGCLFLDAAPITIGRNTLIAPNVKIYCATHPVCPEQRLDFETAYPVKIGDSVWIGGNSTICPGVTIGDGSTIGAGSVVTKDVPPNVVVAGNPARVIRYLPESDFKNKIKKTYHNLSY